MSIIQYNARKLYNIYRERGDNTLVHHHDIPLDQYVSLIPRIMVYKLYNVCRVVLPFTLLMRVGACSPYEEVIVSNKAMHIMSRLPSELVDYISDFIPSTTRQISYARGYYNAYWSGDMNLHVISSAINFLIIADGSSVLRYTV
jgi:hypothetical protein